MNVSRETDRTDAEQRRVAVYGAVQGVGFRYFVRQAARQHGVAGYVLNRPDGSVLIEARGAEAALNHLFRAVTQGPPHSHVDRIEPLEPESEELPLPFEIRH